MSLVLLIKNGRRRTPESVRLPSFKFRVLVAFPSPGQRR